MSGADRYVLDEGLPGGTVPPGTNVLVLGSQATAPRSVALRILAYGCDHSEPAVVVSADRSAGQLRREYVETVGAEPDAGRFRVVDCSATSTDEVVVLASTVTSPADLTGIGIGLVKATQKLDASGGLRLAVLSLSTVLQYGTVDRTFNFAHVLTGRVAADDYLGVYTLDPTMHDETDVNALRSLFDRVVELRDGENGREARVVGGPGGSTAWEQY